MYSKVSNNRKPKSDDASAWRKRVTHSLLNADSDDEILELFNDNKKQGTETASTKYVETPNITDAPEKTVQVEERIVAPKVGKLSPGSAVEVRLVSSDKSIAVLCSVDVLKMRSGYFYNILIEQEHSDQQRAQANHIVWRTPITVAETSLFEAAAFLESLHESRALFKGEWNLSWARLSVTWMVEDLVLEYAAQIQTHMQKITDFVTKHNWRINPSVLAGMRVSVFRKSSNVVPTIITGTATDSRTNIGYSKLRVIFDSDKVIANANHGSFIGKYPATPVPKEKYDQHEKEDFLTPAVKASIEEGNANLDNVIGDITEPFWIQNTREENAQWMDPDDLFLIKSRDSISNNDKRIFWEMARALMEHQQLSEACTSGIKTAKDLTTILKRPEYRVMWTSGAPHCLPKEVAAELIESAYIVHEKAFGQPVEY